MTVTTRGHDYEIGNAPFDGALVWDDAWVGRRPCVMIFHGWEGRSDAQVEVGETLARAGYAAFACDLFGKGVRGDLTGDNSALIAPPGPRAAAGAPAGERGGGAARCPRSGRTVSPRLGSASVACASSTWRAPGPTSAPPSASTGCSCRRRGWSPIP